MDGQILKSWAKTQKVIAMSSGEAELYAAVKAASESLGVQSLLRDLGVKGEKPPVLHLDAQAAIGTMQRRGLGDARHVDVAWLWVQEAVRDKRILIHKIPGIENPADMMTKYIPAGAIEKHLLNIGCTRL